MPAISATRRDPAPDLSPRDEPRFTAYPLFRPQHQDAAAGFRAKRLNHAMEFPVLSRIPANTVDDEISDELSHSLGQERKFNNPKLAIESDFYLVLVTQASML